MRIKYFAALLALANLILLPLPSRADWRDTLIRVVGPPLVNRGINYLFSGKRAGGPRNRSAVSRAAPTWADTAPSSGGSPAYIPPRPVVSHSVPKQTKAVSASSTKLQVPPPPQTMVPPPPPGVPTGAVLGMYPIDLNEISEPPAVPKGKIKPTPPPETASLPKLAPDFRKQAQH
jgi:hypothetical protein